MSKIKLDDRLSAVAGLVRNGKRVADIGTDHGYLVAYLVENGMCPSGIPADLRKGPLENARQTVIQQGGGVCHVCNWMGHAGNQGGEFFVKSAIVGHTAASLG